ncbi:MAG: hypothetical protein PHW75_00575 [Patescibacteria group bacterium]|nr:hypothetical protein [Patescibacteria group bacterium]
MAEKTKKAKITAEWDEATEKKIEQKISEWSKSCKADKGAKAGAGAVYGLGLIGALVYFLGSADGFTEVVVGILKAIVWPGFLVYELMKFLGM